MTKSIGLNKDLIIFLYNQREYMSQILYFDYIHNPFVKITVMILNPQHQAITQYLT